MGLKIGELAMRTGTNAPTIRYYEDVGLLPNAVRGEGGQRDYGVADVRLLTFIRQCRDFGFSIEQVRTLVGVMQDRSRDCVEARDLAQAHLDTVRAKLKELRALETSIASFVKSCEAQCCGGPGTDCIVLQDLAQPKKARATRKRSQ